MSRTRRSSEKYGYLYPWVRRCFGRAWWWSVAGYLPKVHDRRWIDVYVFIWVGLEIVMLVWPRNWRLQPVLAAWGASLAAAIGTGGTTLCVTVLALFGALSLVVLCALVWVPWVASLYRLSDFVGITLHSLVRPKSPRRKPMWASRTRTFLFGFVNLFELFLIFAFLYVRFPGTQFSRGGVKTALTWFDALYFSVVTGITLGYGDISPSSPTAKILCMVQPILVVVVLLPMISYATGSHEESTLEDSRRRRR